MRWGRTQRRGGREAIAGRKPASITRVEVSDLVRKHARSAPISGNRKLAYASAFFNWCVEEGVVEENPAKKVRKPARENERDRFHSLEELKEIWAATGELGYPCQQLYRLLIVLPMRREEIAAMPVTYFTLGDDREPDQAIWILPAARTKKANALRVPLSPLARSIILEALNHEERPKDSKLLFTTTGDTSVSGFTKAKRRLDRKFAEARAKAVESGAGEGGEVPIMPHWTVHDLRTTFDTHACEILEVPPHIADRILNHVAAATRSKIMRVYPQVRIVRASPAGAQRKGRSYSRARRHVTINWNVPQHHGLYPQQCPHSCRMCGRVGTSMHRGLVRLESIESKLDILTPRWTNNGLPELERIGTDRLLYLSIVSIPK